MKTDLWIPRPTIWLTENVTRDMHWATLRGHQQEWRRITWARLVITKLDRRLPQGIPSTIEPLFIFAMNRRRDPHNWMPTLKPIIDEMVAFGIWPDDNPEWLDVSEPSMVVRRKGEEGVMLTITPRIER